jgi:putative aldouronate transport system substrate-binding protein
MLARDTLVIRQDWIDKVGQPLPQNADQFLALMTAFAKSDPDGNGKADTYGLGSGSIEPFCMQFIKHVHRVPNGWKLNPDGTLTKDYETPEFKLALAFARKLFEAGAYHPDAANGAALPATAFDSGKVGADIGTVTIDVYGTGGTQSRIRALNPVAKLTSLVAFGHDGGKGVTYNGPGFLGFAAIPAKVGRDPERVKELLRVLDYFAAPFGSEEWVFLYFGLEGVHHEIKADGSRELTARGKAELGDRFNLPNLPNLTNCPQVSYYQGAPGDAEYVQDVARDMLAIGLDNPTLSLSSPTNVTKAAELNQLYKDRLTSIIVGREPLTAVDTFIADWRSRGGDQIRTEFEQELKG